MYLYSGMVVALLVAARVSASEPSSSESTSGLLSGVRIMYKTYQQCEDQGEVMGCLKMRALRLLERALVLENIPLTDGVALVRRPDSERSLNDIAVDESSLPADSDARDKRIDSLLWDKVGRFLQTHSLQVQVPKIVEKSQQFLESELEDDVEDQEGRGKKKKLIGPLLVGMMMKGTLIAIAFKALALLAGKALLVSKLALVLAGLIALKKLFSGGEQKTTYEIVKQPVVTHSHQYSTGHEYGGGIGGGGGGGHEYSGHGGGYGRSMESVVPYPHLLAYRGQLPEQQQVDATVAVVEQTKAKAQ